VWLAVGGQAAPDSYPFSSSIRRQKLEVCLCCRACTGRCGDHVRTPYSVKVYVRRIERWLKAGTCSFMLSGCLRVFNLLCIRVPGCNGVFDIQEKLCLRSCTLKPRSAIYKSALQVFMATSIFSPEIKRAFQVYFSLWISSYPRSYTLNTKLPDICDKHLRPSSNTKTTTSHLLINTVSWHPNHNVNAANSNALWNPVHSLPDAFPTACSLMQHRRQSNDCGNHITWYDDLSGYHPIGNACEYLGTGESISRVLTALLISRHDVWLHLRVALAGCTCVQHSISDSRY
jgi:hypothetical protein